MRKKLLLVSVLICSIVILVSCTTSNKVSMTGRYLKSSDGKVHIIIDGTNGPIVMGNATEKDDLFEGLQSGDEIEITTTGEIRETYPAGTDIYSCKLIKRGTKEDIPKEVLNSLEEMGWKFDFTQFED